MKKDPQAKDAPPPKKNLTNARLKIHFLNLVFLVQMIPDWSFRNPLGREVGWTANLWAKKSQEANKSFQLSMQNRQGRRKLSEKQRQKSFKKSHKA